MSKRILLCDDAFSVRASVKEMLVKNGYEVVAEAENGSEAVARYSELLPDLVLLDITMPVMDGVTALKKIRNADKNARIVILAAMGQNETAQSCVKLGAKDFIVKPFFEKKLIDLLKTVLPDA